MEKHDETATRSILVIHDAYTITIIHVQRVCGVAVGQWRFSMKTKSSFFKKSHTSLLLATATLLLLSMQSATFADDGTWASLASTDWNTNGNWLTVPAGGTYPGTTAGNTATFHDLSTVTSLFVSLTPANSIAAITFD